MSKRDELRPKDLHFRPECDSDLFKCGAHVSWNEGFSAGVEACIGALRKDDADVYDYTDPSEWADWLEERKESL